MFLLSTTLPSMSARGVVASVQLTTANLAAARLHLGLMAASPAHGQHRRWLQARKKGELRKARRRRRQCQEKGKKQSKPIQQKEGKEKKTKNTRIAKNKKNAKQKPRGNKICTDPWRRSPRTQRRYTRAAETGAQGRPALMAWGGGGVAAGRRERAVGVWGPRLLLATANLAVARLHLGLTVASPAHGQHQRWLHARKE